MIILEDKLDAIFQYIPEMRYSVDSPYYNVTFGYGTQVELNKFIHVKTRNSEERPYPLIWLLYPNKETHSERKLKVTDMCLILAVNNSSQMSYQERIDSTYKKILNPLLRYVWYAFDKAVNVNLNPEFEAIKFPNYSHDTSEEESFAIDIWDAYKTFWNLEINDACLKDIRYNVDQDPVQDTIVPLEGNEHLILSS